jgi:formyltetrahydrofolate deformylase
MDGPVTPPGRSTATLNVIGQDKSGVIAKIATFLYRQGGNIEELDQHVTHGLFTMQVEISWPRRRLAEDQVRRGLERLGKRLEMTILFRPHRGGRRRPRLAILVTTEAHCLDRLVQDCRKGRIDAEIAVVASNKPDLGAHVEALGLPFVHADDRDKAAHEAALLAEFDRREIDYVVLARYMKILSPNFVWRYPNRIVNIHPSLLPSFPGAYAYRQAHRHGVRVHGVTAHFVTMNLDEGPIITQKAFELRPGASLAEVTSVGRRQEAQVLAEAVKLLVAGRLDVHWGRVEVRPGGSRTGTRSLRA